MFYEYLIAEAVDVPGERGLMKAPFCTHIYPGDIVRDEDGTMYQVIAKSTLAPSSSELKMIMATGIDDYGQAISIVRDEAIVWEENNERVSEGTV